MVRTLTFRLPLPALACLALLLTACSSSSEAALHIPGDYPTFEEAYKAAADGDTIEVAAGVYEAQVVPVGTKKVTFHGLPGNQVRKLDNHASNVTFDGIDVDAGMTTPNGAAFENHVEGEGGRNVTFRNGQIGNVVDQKGVLLGGPAAPEPINTVFDNVRIHDVLFKTEGVHNECVFSEAPGLTIRNSTFSNCSTMDLFIVRGDWWNQEPYGNVTLENNVFQHSTNGDGWHHYGLYWSNDAFKDVRVVNNTFENLVILDNLGSGPYSGVWANNIGGGWQCLEGVTYRHNVGSKCDASDRATNPVSSCAMPACPPRTMPVGWVDPAKGDFHLKKGSIAIDFGDPEYAPATDHDCAERDDKPDAGAYEYGASPCGDRPDSEAAASPPPASAAAPPALAIRSARLSKRAICRHARRGCPRRATLTVTLSTPAKVTVRVGRRTLRAAAATRRTLRIKAQGLRARRYAVRITATDALGRSVERRLALRVRS